MKNMFFVILAMLIVVSVSAASKHAPPPVTVVAATAEQAAKSAALEKSGGKVTVVVDANLAPVVPILPTRNTNIFVYGQTAVNRYSVDTAGKKVIVDKDNQIVSYVPSKTDWVLPGAYVPPAQDPIAQTGVQANQQQQSQSVAYSAPYYSSGYSPVSYSAPYSSYGYGSGGYTEKVRFHPWGTSYSYWGTPTYTSYGNYGGYGGGYYGDGRYYGPYTVTTTISRDYGLAVGAVGTTYRY